MIPFALLAEFNWYALLGMPQIMFISGGLIAIIAIICWQWKSVELGRRNADLKSQMIERGFSPEEIERVIRANNET